MARPVALESSIPFSVRLNWQFLWMGLLLLVVAFVVITPLTLMFINSFQITGPGEPAAYGLDGWRMAFTSPGMLSAMWNTASLAIVRQIVALVVGVFLAWLLARTDIPMKGTLEFLFWLSFFLPALPITMGWILLLDPKFGMLNQWLVSL